MAITSLKDLESELLNNSDFASKFRADPQTVIHQLAQSSSIPHTYDRWLYRFAVVILGLVVVTVLGAAVYHEFGNSPKDLSQILLSFGFTALGALAGLIAPASNP